jgi:predicted ester cyclase
MDGRATRRAVVAAAIAAGAVLPDRRGGMLAAMRDGDGKASDAARGGAPGTRQEDRSVDAQANKALWQPWLALWNGDLAVADEIVAPEFVAHFAPLGSSPSEVRGPAGLTEWIGGILSAFSDHRFATTVGPLADGELVAGHWLFRGTYRGGIPGASPAAAGTAVEYAGIDILRVEAGRIVEYWLCADTLVLLQQVGVILA